MTNKEAAEILKLYNQRLDESCSNLLDRDKEAFDLAIKALENERPTGEWIDGIWGYYCSVCGEIDGRYFDHNFCPNCGAKMKVRKEE